MQPVENIAVNSASSEAERTLRMAAVFSALANPARIQILRHISRHEQCKCKEITDVLPLAQSTVSQHLKVLVDAKLIVCETVHPSSHYRVNNELVNEVAGATKDFLKGCCRSGDCR